MNKNTHAGRLSAFLAGFLSLLLLLSFPAAAVENELDYGNGGDSDQFLTASELFDKLFADDDLPALSAEERAALDALSEVMLAYNDSIPASVIQNNYDGELGIFTARIKPYSYVASNGKTVSWIPTSVSMDGGVPKVLTGPNENGEYICTFADLWHSDDLVLDVDFVWQVEIPAQTADGLLTLPYTVGKQTADALAAYERDNTAHQNAAAAFQAYETAQKEYDQKLADYNTYAALKKDYDAKKAAYDAYLLEKKSYDEKVAAYKLYSEKLVAYKKAEKEYYEFEEFRKQYESIYDAYERYTKELEGALSRLEIMESMFLSDSHGWQFYGGVMGSTVDSVLGSRDLLVEYAAVDPIYIDAAAKATEALRPLLKGYATVRSAKYETKLARYRAEFAYYSENYEGIRDQVKKLYQALYALYDNSGVYYAMNSGIKPEVTEKVPHFEQFLGQMYVLYRALDDNDPEPTKPWTLTSKVPTTLEMLVEPELLLPDTDSASPIGVTMPEVEVTLPGDGEFPEPVEKPVKDFEDMEDPTLNGAPTEVANPGKAPAEVKHPGNPPTVVLRPGNAPVKPQFSKVEEALASALQKGTLQQRAALGCPQMLSLRQTVSCIRSITNRKTVSFYGADGKKLSDITVEYGGSVIPPDMTRPNDDRYSYTFLGWVPFGSGDISQRVNLESVKEDLSLSPIYQKTDRIYEIIWIVNGQRRVEYYRWNEVPTCPMDLTHPSGADRYRFDGFSPAVVPVAGNATYTAQYTELPPTYTVTWVLGDRTEQSTVVKGELPVCPISTDREPNEIYFYEFIGWNKSFEPVLADATYRAEYREQSFALYNNGSTCAVELLPQELKIASTQPVLNFAGAISYACSTNRSVTLTWENYSVRFSPAELKVLSDAHCVKLECQRSTGEAPESVLFSFRYLNSIGQELKLSQKLSVTVEYTPMSGMYVMAYQVSGKTLKEAPMTRYTDGRAVLSVAAGTEMIFRPEYLLQFSDPTQNCNLTAFPPHAPLGSTVLLNANCTFGYEISSATLRFADGSTQTVSGSFVMPRQAVSVELHVTRMVYHVSFVADGIVISETDLFFGDSVPLPPNPTKAEDEDFVYSFSGWTPYVTRATGEDRNPVYTASFTRTPKANTDLPTLEKDPFFTVVLPIVISCSVGAILLLVFCIVFRHRLGGWLRRLGRLLCKLGVLLLRLLLRACKALAIGCKKLFCAVVKKIRQMQERRKRAKAEAEKSAKEVEIPVAPNAFEEAAEASAEDQTVEETKQ